MKKHLLQLLLGGMVLPSFAFGAIPAPRASYDFDGSLSDSSGNGLNLSGSPVFTVDRFGNVDSALNQNSFYQLSSSSLVLGDKPFSVSFWLKLDSVPSEFGERVTMHGSWNSRSGTFSIAVWNDGRTAVSVSTSSGERFVISNPGVLTTNGWAHLAFAMTGTNLVFYVNSTKIGEETATLLSKTAPLIFGGENGHLFDSGRVDDFLLFTQSLSESQVQEIFHTGNGVELGLGKAFFLNSMNLIPGISYQLQTSTNLVSWQAVGGSFVATNSIWESTQYWKVEGTNQVFFRLMAQ